MSAFIDLSPEKRLRTGRSVWNSTAHPPLITRSLRKSASCDIAIVGAGISGAFMAEALSRHYPKVLVLDRRSPAAGATHASTAMLQFEIDTPLTQLADQIGHKGAALAWQRSRQATRDLIAQIRALNIRCGLAERHALYLTGDEMGWRGMRDEARARKRIGLDCEFLDEAALKARFGIARTGAILSPGAAVADPVALARGLLRRALRRGARVHAPCDVRGVISNRQGVVLDAGGYFVQARAAIFCTGYELLKEVPKTGTRITSSWAAATAPRADYPDWLDRTLVWEAAKPYLYMRTTPDGRLIVGGEDADLDSPGFRHRTLGKKADRLAAKTATLLHGRKPRWTHVWAGAFGESSDGLPIIDAVPGMENCFTVMGFGGNGTIYSKIAADIMPALIKGRRSAAARLFEFR